MDNIIVVSQVFDYLVKTFGERPENISLFIHEFGEFGSHNWQIISEKGQVGFIRRNPNSMTIEFFKVENVEVHQKNLNDILNLNDRKKRSKEAEQIEQFTAKMRGQNREFKSGDVFEFGAEKSNVWRDITPTDIIASSLGNKSPGFIGLNPDGSLTKPWAWKLGDG